MINKFTRSALSAAVLSVTLSAMPVLADQSLEGATESQTQGYAIGASVATYIAQTIEQQAELGLELDREFVLQGMSDALSGDTKMSQEEIQAQLTALDAKLNTLMEAKSAEQAALAVEEGKAFLAENASKDGITVTESGLQYKVEQAGEGDKPSAEDTVTVHYEGKLLDGTVFDSSIERGEPVSFPLNRVIPGWTEGVQLMSPGAKYTFFIPSELAYGEAGAGQSIPPHATLTFSVELISIEKAEVVVK
ncbi:FKBP-type peptidyl-prolyl cis-trans isomerase [Alginatibacterium sediminis]|uniref:Peptidyl-prolyl cis-trans isomerase n=1 Tax=Alginatibacterium sediminis TaxID=2164068 RepID=A0A420E7P9_9ALTE|nr:FKBP-type peptidyl-prolyl cis-trans isomerase [Alginatibacterium sediminis]RKF14435.1 FKBP-type peptidyl-prolyl cis-trans isomerase [Alginatibacterium sediminis]